MHYSLGTLEPLLKQIEDTTAAISWQLGHENKYQCDNHEAIAELKRLGDLIEQQLHLNYKLWSIASGIGEAAMGGAAAHGDRGHGH